MKYRKKPVVIEALQFFPSMPLYQISVLFAGEKVDEPSKFERQGDVLLIKTLEGTMVARVGDYIIKGVKGEFYPCKSDIFWATYEPVE